MMKTSHEDGVLSQLRLANLCYRGWRLLHDQHERQSKQLFQNYFYHLKNISKIKLLVLKAELEMIIWIIVTVILFILTNQL